MYVYVQILFVYEKFDEIWKKQNMLGSPVRVVDKRQNNRVLVDTRTIAIVHKILKHMYPNNFYHVKIQRHFLYTKSLKKGWDLFTISFPPPIRKYGAPSFLNI